MAGFSGIALTALTLVLLSNCELIRSVRLTRPLEFFLLSPERSAATPLPYVDPTGAVSGFLAPEPGLVVERIEDIIMETKQLPVFSRGRVTGKQAHLFARIFLRKRDRKRLEAFTQPAVGSVLLTRMNGKVIATNFLTEPLTGPEFVISGPENAETLEAIRIIQSSLPGAATVPADK
jgi:hypothetical protein